MDGLMGGWNTFHVECMFFVAVTVLEIANSMLYIPFWISVLNNNHDFLRRFFYYSCFICTSLVQVVVSILQCLLIFEVKMFWIEWCHTIFWPWVFILGIIFIYFSCLPYCHIMGIIFIYFSCLPYSHIMGIIFIYFSCLPYCHIIHLYNIFVWYFKATVR
jgi:hypothetical protein